MEFVIQVASVKDYYTFYYTDFDLVTYVKTCTTKKSIMKNRANIHINETKPKLTKNTEMFFQSSYFLQKAIIFDNIVFNFSNGQIIVNALTFCGMLMLIVWFKLINF